jgi:hypothetical protein
MAISPKLNVDMREEWNVKKWSTLHSSSIIIIIIIKLAGNPYRAGLCLHYIRFT